MVKCEHYIKMLFHNRGRASSFTTRNGHNRDQNNRVHNNCRYRERTFNCEVSGSLPVDVNGHLVAPKEEKSTRYG